MVAAIAEGNTTQFEVLRWAWDQGQHLDATAQLVLVYLCSHAFYTEDNPEHGEVGQVLYQASYVKSIMAGTGIRGQDSVRRVLDRLQDSAYIQRERRDDHGTRVPNRIYVLWTPDAADLREGLRNRNRKLPVALMERPSAPPKRPQQRPALVLIQGGSNSAHPSE